MTIGLLRAARIILEGEELDLGEDCEEVVREVVEAVEDSEAVVLCKDDAYYISRGRVAKLPFPGKQETPKTFILME